MFKEIFSSLETIPNGHGYLLSPELVGIKHLSDLLMAIAYFAIPAMLIFLLYKRRDIPFQGIFTLLVALIFLLGTGQLMQIWTLWYPVKGLTEITQLLTTLVFCYTAVQILRLLPQVLALKTPEQSEPKQALADSSDRQQVAERLWLLERVMAASTNSIVITDVQVPGNPIIYVNPAFESITGYSASEVIGKNYEFLQGADTAQPALAEMRLAMQEQRECRLVMRSYRQDGSLFWNEFSIAPVRDDSGQLTHYLIIHSDITEERTAVEALTQQFKRTLLLKQITEKIRSSLEPQQIFTTAAQQIGLLLKVDRCLIHTYVAEPEPKIPIVAEFIAPGIQSLINLEIPVLNNPHIQQLLAQEAALSSPDVTAEPLLEAAQLICQQVGLKSLLAVRTSYQGQPNGAICLHQCANFRSWTRDEKDLLESVAAQLGIAIAQASLLQQEKQARLELDQQNLQLQQEIIERLRMAEEIQQTQNFLDSVIENIPDMFFVKDAKDLKFVRFNKAGEELIGYSKEDLLGKSDVDFFPPDLADSFIAKDRQVLSTGQLLDIPAELILTKDKGMKILHTKKMPIFDQAGNPQYVLGLSEDITERKQAEIALQQQVLRERLVATMQERIRSSLNLKEVLNTAVEEVRQFLSIDRTIIFRFNPDWSGVVVVESIGEEWRPMLGAEINDPCFGASYTSLYQQGRYRAIENIHTCDLNPCHVNLLSLFQVKANLVVPILQTEETIQNSLAPTKPHNKLWGLLIANHCGDSRQWHPSEIESLQQLSVQLAIAIQQCTLFEQAKAEISDRKRAELALQHSNTRYQNLATNIPGMIYQFMLYPDGKMTFPYMSPGCQALFGIDPKMGQEDIDFIFNTIDPDDLDGVKESIFASAQSLEPWHCVWRIRMEDKVKWLQGDARPEKQADGSILWDGLVIDISDRFQAELELRRAKEAADVANHAKSEFLAAMSHELRTPLNAILGFTQVMVRDSSLSKEQQQYLEIINRSGEHLLEQINGILEMSKIEAGQITFNKNSFDLIRLLESLKELFHLKAQSKGLQLQIDYLPNLPQYVQTDESKLRQVLINLLGNAIKFTETGEVTLRVRVGNPLKVSVQETGTLQSAELPIIFSVEDTGPGMAPEEIEQLFKPFVQTEAGRKLQQGTGLGLPISHKFVQIMGGDLTISSRLGGGSIFTFDIRINQVEATHMQSVLPPPKVIGLVPDQQPYRILVVEDRLESRILLVKLLTSVGFEVLEAENGQEAIALWKSWEPHLIWMDMRMPVMNGYEATQHIKASLKGQATVIIALTASAFEEQRNLILSAGCDDFIRKPFRDTLIFEKIAQHLGVRYIYEEPVSLPTPEPKAPQSQSQILESTIALMPSEWVASLHQAALEADGELILELAKQIPQSNTLILKNLKALVKNFQLETISDFLEKFHDE